MTTFVDTVVATLEDAPKSKWGRLLVFQDEQQFRWMLMRHDPDSKILIGVKTFRAKHSPNQRGYLHGVVIPAMLERMGFVDSKENHNRLYFLMKEKYGQCEKFVTKDGELILFPKSMSDADTLEMHQLIDGAIEWAGTYLGLTIPPAQRVIYNGVGI